MHALDQMGLSHLLDEMGLDRMGLDKVRRPHRHDEETQV